MPGFVEQPGDGRGVHPQSLAWLERFEEGRAWLGRLPALLDDVCRRWRLVPGAPFDGGTCGLVVPVAGSRGLQAVVKLQFPDRESRLEADALRTWNGAGAVRLLDHDADRHALLIERCQPGTPLSQAAPDEALRVLVGLLVQLSVPVATPFTPLPDEAACWREHLPATWERAGRPFERELLDQALELLDHLVATHRDAVLVHQDLHGANVLAAEREPWLVIDPKPVAGEIAFALAPIVRSAELGHSRRAVLHRLDHLADALGVDRERARGWAVVQTLAWSFDDLTPLQGHLDVVRWLLEGP